MLFNEDEPSVLRNSTQSGGAQSADGKDNANIAAEEEEDDVFDEEDEPSFPARVNVTIEKVRSSGKASKF